MTRLLLSGGFLNVRPGGTADTVHLSSGGTVIRDGFAFSIVVAEASSGQTLSGFELTSGNMVVVHSGGTAIGTTIDGFAEELVQSGGNSISGTIEFEGLETMVSGGYDTGTTISYGGRQQVSGVAVSAVVLSGGNQQVWSAGSAFGTILSNGGSQSVELDGYAGGTIVNSGALLENFADQDFRFRKGRGCLRHAGSQWWPVRERRVRRDTTVSQGGLLVMVGIAEQGGTLTLLSGANYEIAFGSVDGPGGFSIAVPYEQFISDGQTSTGIIDAGELVVSDGGTANQTLLIDGGLLIVSAGGRTVGTHAYGSALDAPVDFSFAMGGTEYLSGGVATGTMVANYGRQVVSFGGIASNTVVSSAGTQVVLFDGLAISTIIAQSGVEVVANGGTTSDTTILNGGTLEMISGGMLSGDVTFHSGGIFAIASGYTVSNYRVSSGLTLELIQGGVQSGTTTIDFGGTLAVGLDYILGDFTVSDGQTLAGSSGGTISNVTVSAGGIVRLFGGATLEGTETYEAGAELRIDSGFTYFVSSGVSRRRHVHRLFGHRFGNEQRRHHRDYHRLRGQGGRSRHDDRNSRSRRRPGIRERIGDLDHRSRRRLGVDCRRRHDGQHRLVGCRSVHFERHGPAARRSMAARWLDNSSITPTPSRRRCSAVAWSSSTTGGTRSAPW